MGRFSDGNIFANSPVGQLLSNGSIDLPDPKPLPGQTSPTPYVFIGDEAFPLMTNLMRPFPKMRVTNNYENKVFNYRLSRGRQTVECAFGILASRFRVFKRPFECKLETIDKIVLATTVLHNYLRTKSLSHDTSREEDSEITATPCNTQLTSLTRNGNRCTNESFFVRQKFTDCFSSCYGSVDWQHIVVGRGHY